MSFAFLRRSECSPLVVLQSLFNVLKQRKHLLRRVRVDEDESLANSCEFNELLVDNFIQMETTAGHGSKLNRIIERPNREHNAKTRVAMGMQHALPISYWHFGREHVCFIKEGLGMLALSLHLFKNGQVSRSVVK